MTEGERVATLSLLRLTNCADDSHSDLIENRLMTRRKTQDRDVIKETSCVLCLAPRLCIRARCLASSLFADRLKGFGIVHSEVSEDLTIDLNPLLV